MKVLKYIALAVSALALAACASNTSYTVTGTVPEDCADQTLYLVSFSNERIDSCSVADGKYEFKGSVDGLGQVVYVVGQSMRPVAEFYLEPGTITVTSQSSATGTAGNDAFSSWMAAVDTIQTVEVLTQDLMMRLEDHCNDGLGASMLAMFGGYLDAAVLASALEMCSDEVKASKMVKPMVEKVEKIAATAVGKMFVDVELEQPDGSVAKLSEYIGNGSFVLVDFWASWCGPCRRAIPTVIECYRKYSVEGLKILGVAINDKYENTLKAIESEGILWPVISDQKVETGKAYGFDAIPEFILFAPDGTIVARDFYVDSLDAVLAENLK